MTRLLVAVAVVVTAWTAIGGFARATYGSRTTADEPQYLLSAISLANDGNLDIADELREGAFIPFHEEVLPEQTKRLPDGSRVSPHDPLLPALLAAPVVLGGWLAAKLTLAAMAGALAAGMLWVAVRRYRVSPAVATVVVLAFAAVSPLVVYGTQVYPELPAALAVTAAIGAVTAPPDRARIIVFTVAARVAPLAGLQVRARGRGPGPGRGVVLGTHRTLRGGGRRRRGGDGRQPRPLRRRPPSHLHRLDGLRVGRPVRRRRDDGHGGAARLPQPRRAPGQPPGRPPVRPRRLGAGLPLRHPRRSRRWPGAGHRARSPSRCPSPQAGSTPPSSPSPCTAGGGRGARWSSSSPAS